MGNHKSTTGKYKKQIAAIEKRTSPTSKQKQTYRQWRALVDGEVRLRVKYKKKLEYLQKQESKYRGSANKEGKKLQNGLVETSTLYSRLNKELGKKDKKNPAEIRRISVRIAKIGKKVKDAAKGYEKGADKLLDYKGQRVAIETKIRTVSEAKHKMENFYGTARLEFYGSL